MNTSPAAERSIWSDAYDLRRKYAGCDLKDNAHELCSITVDALRLRLRYDNHPLAALLAQTMTDEYTTRWMIANGKARLGN